MLRRSTSDTEFKGQEYLGLYPTVGKIAGLEGRHNLGFTNAGSAHEELPLTKAANRQGVYFTS